MVERVRPGRLFTTVADRAGPTTSRPCGTLSSANDDYRTYDRPQKALVGRAASLAKTDAVGQAFKKAKKVPKALEAA